ncbi:MAG: hypothetical protein CL681_02230 [Blastopirellula sp.]|nr:hypothetical protein [Blastopirellula sp.]
MSLLAPLFALGAVAIGIPFLFHLIQRRPKGETEFSSLMFLKPSPPRLTRRSRLDNLLLLLLRVACILLLALAFTRPFLRSTALLGLHAPARRIVMLVDTSASMRRQDTWKQALQEVNSVVDDLQATDQFALLTFDASTTQVIGFDDLQDTPNARRGTSIKERIRDIRPTWYPTNLGLAVVQAAELLETAAESVQQEGSLPPQIILVSDMQTGSRLYELDAFEWPADVKLDIRTVQPQKMTNASLRLLPPAATETVEDQMRVRVSNTQASSSEQFQVGWSDKQGKLLGREYSIHVPAGQSRVAKIDRPPPLATHVRLVGDDHAFDNTYYWATIKPRARTLLYLGEAAPDDREHLSHYLKHLVLDNATATVSLEMNDGTQPLINLDPIDTPLVVIAQALPAESNRTLKRYLAEGGRVLLVVPRQTDSTDFQTMIEQLTDAGDVSLQEAEIDDYAMFGDIDFQHPLFQVFSDPRFNDFTKVRFWSHRRLQATSATWKNIATYDDNDPLLVEQQYDQGRLWILTSGWHPAESQLALSTKFVPLFTNMFQSEESRSLLSGDYAPGDKVLLPLSDTSIQTPDGKTVTATKSVFTATEAPGVYSLAEDKGPQSFAVNLDADESKTSPVEIDTLEQRGVVIGKSRSLQELKDQQRQMRDMELERRQNIWRWLIVSVLGLLFMETWLGGWITMRRKTQA